MNHVAAGSLLFLASAIACGSAATPSTSVPDHTAEGDAGGVAARPDARSDSSRGPSKDAAPGASYPAGAHIGTDPQQSGDAAAGYTALVNNGYIGCGIPYSLYEQYFGAAPASSIIPGRTGHNATLPYNYTAFVAESGVELVTENCLTCHASAINGQLVVGLGAAAADFTKSLAAYAAAAGGAITDPTEHAEWAKWNDRVQAISPYVVTKTVGQNPADNLAAVLFAHRDANTLAWSDTPLLPLPAADVVPVHVPPWWRMKKKNAMFYNASGRGDHARIMMTASTLCTDSVPQAEAIDAYFPDIEAYIASIPPPRYPFPIDQAKAAAGHDVFAVTCAACHGTYDGTGTYPNLVFKTEDVGTDSTLATSSEFAHASVNWFNTSWYGTTAHLDPQPGYVAPPLDGIWSTAPYLHNGSVPTIGSLLDSKTRPALWTRTFSSTDYDRTNLGWNFTSVAAGQNGADVYDTTQFGSSNAGHTYGDALSDGDRAAVLEYLKTL